MGPLDRLGCQVWDHPGVAWVLPVVGPLYWPNELPGGIGDRDRGNAAAVAAGVEVAGGGPADVENEVNGFFSYDRLLMKMDVGTVAQRSRAVIVAGSQIND
jgi:hypothetical protein